MGRMQGVNHAQLIATTREIAAGLRAEGHVEAAEYGEAWANAWEDFVASGRIDLPSSLA